MGNEELKALEAHMLRLSKQGKYFMVCEVQLFEFTESKIIIFTANKRYYRRGNS